jgi:hypothetical protein
MDDAAISAINTKRMDEEIRLPLEQYKNGCLEHGPFASMVEEVIFFDSCWPIDQSDAQYRASMAGRAEIIDRWNSIEGGE